MNESLTFCHIVSSHQHASVLAAGAFGFSFRPVLLLSGWTIGSNGDVSFSSLVALEDISVSVFQCD